MLQYDFLKGSLANANKLKAIGLIIDGLQSNDKSIFDNQDQSVQLAEAEALKSISLDYASIASSDLMLRAVETFYQLTVTNNNEIIAKERALEFTKQSFESLFAFVENTLASIELIAIKNQESIKLKLQLGVEYMLRGVLTNEPTGNIPLIKRSSNLSIAATKINSGGFDKNLTLNFTSPEGLNASILLPKSATFKKTYLQLVVIMTKDSVYNTKGLNAGSNLKTGMMKIKLDETEPTMGVSESKILSKSIAVKNLTEPIIINIPFTGNVKEKMTLS